MKIRLEVLAENSKELDRLACVIAALQNEFPVEVVAVKKDEEIQKEVAALVEKPAPVETKPPVEVVKEIVEAGKALVEETVAVDLPMIRKVATKLISENKKAEVDAVILEVGGGLKLTQIDVALYPSIYEKLMVL